MDDGLAAPPRRMSRSGRLATIGATVVLAAAGCSSDAGRVPTASPSSTERSAPASSTGPSATASSTAPTAVTAPVPPPSSGGDPTLALDAGPSAPAVDANVPSEPPAAAIGRAGYTRYVYTDSGGQVIPALLEGPRRSQTRCQEPGLPCSSVDLRELARSGDAIPPELGLDAVELDALVAELVEVETAISSFGEADSACAAGYLPDDTQTPNMGSHFSNDALIRDGEFEPGRPEILLYARRGGLDPEGAPLGRCVDGGWEGADVEIVGVAYFVPRYFVGDDHFGGFTGDLDNWHIHYNLCRLDGRDVTVAPDLCGDGVPDGPEDAPRGEASEGWMIHAWADPGHDNQLGVFSMWNPTLWPVASADEVHDRGSLSDTTADANVITDFALPDIAVPPATTGAPLELSFFNADDIAHTVTAGEPTAPAGGFDSGTIAGRDAATITIAGPGTYRYFCTIHPEMQATITVGND